MQIDVITLFPEMFRAVTGSSILKRAQESGRLQLVLHDLREYTHDKHRTVDDRPYGGGPGMIMKPEPIFKAVEAIRTACRTHAPSAGQCETILMSPQGTPLNSDLANQMAMAQHVTIICGHYEGVDERVNALTTRRLSIGDYVLTGGELPAMVFMDAMARLIPGVIGHDQATVEESFVAGLLEYPQYTRPPVFRGMAVPEVLLSGDHERIAQWRTRQAAAQTLATRPDLVVLRLASLAQDDPEQGPRPSAVARVERSAVNCDNERIRSQP